MSKPVILTGIRSNGELTLGNYLGAIQPMVQLQAQHAGEYQVNMFVPDLHSFTTPIDHGELYENTLQNLSFFVAAGLDLKQPDTYVYRQSYISAHAELAWILDCFTGFGEASRMVEFKDKAAQSESVSVGLFNYPVLMAADILLYHARYVPVGEDQRQHIELARDLAQRLNQKFGDLFTVPESPAKQAEALHLLPAVRIRSLRNPEKKMSKSISDPSGTILLTDKPSDAAQKVLSATTDSEGVINLDWERQPGVSNLLQILSLLSNKELTYIQAEWQGKQNYGDLKKAVAEQVESFLSQFQTRVKDVQTSDILDKLASSETAMQTVANDTLLRVQQAVGLRPKS